MLDLSKEECKIVEQALGSHAEKLTMDKSRMTGRDQKKQVDEHINEAHRLRHKVIDQTKD